MRWKQGIWKATRDGDFVTESQWLERFQRRFRWKDSASLGAYRICPTNWKDFKRKWKKTRGHPIDELSIWGASKTNRMAIPSPEHGHKDQRQVRMEPDAT